jgi:lycopene beta-cyclase
MPRDVDLLIIGGGCAGLSLAMQLAQFGARAPSTLIVEQRRRYDNDRTWCFWGDAQTPFAQQAAHQWGIFKVVNDGEELRVDSSATPYRMLAAEQFYKAATAALEAVSQMRLQMNSTVMFEPRFCKSRWYFETPEGAFSAGRVVDTRPQQRPTQDGALLWQSFYGHEIECEQPVFDPSCVELMNFSAATTDRVAFTYVLPLSPTRALVEFTVFAAVPLTVETLSADLQSAIGQRVKGAAFTVRRSEQGVLPMGLSDPLAAEQGADTSYVRVGLFAGAARPATGYAFQRIQGWAVDCAREIANGGLPLGHPKEPALRGWMDTLFLNVVRRQPQMAPQLFMALFSGVSNHRVIRFLGESGTFFDYAAMAWALPHRPFLRQLMSSLRWP